MNSLIATLTTPTPAEREQELQETAHRHYVKGVWVPKPLPKEKGGRVTVMWYKDTKSYEVNDVISADLLENGDLDMTALNRRWGFQELVFIDHNRKHNFYPVGPHNLSALAVQTLRHPRTNALGVVEKRSPESIRKNRLRRRFVALTNSYAWHLFTRIFLIFLLYALFVITLNLIWPGLSSRTVQKSAAAARNTREQLTSWVVDLLLWRFADWKGEVAPC